MTDASVESGGTSGKTSSTLLARIKAMDQEAWQKFVQLYSPLVYCWCRRFGLQEADTADVGQEVFRTVAEAIGGFQHEPKGASFRGWLRTVTRTRTIDFLRQRARGAQGVGGSEAQALWNEVPDVPEESGAEDQDDRLVLVRRAFEMVLGHCKEESRQAFLRVVVAGEHPADVAQDLGMSVNAVYLAKSHILRKLREEFAEVVEV